VTYGLYVVSSLLAFDPWHMGEFIRRLVQYSKIG
jgi:cellulose synthase/poly-beta-1,6-N-acetylglucosamine synthase-like glycosyltransferase